jgi:hypothetical protein
MTMRKCAALLTAFLLILPAVATGDDQDAFIESFTGQW